MSGPGLSVVVAVGPQRERARATLEAIGAQTAAESTELIVVDVSPDAERLPAPGVPRVVQVVLPPSTPWGNVRAAGVRAASSPVVAFVEDHCAPAPGWAAALLEAHRNPWASVGYAFIVDRSRWSARATLIAEYGLWAHPATGGETRVLPGNNISYKRDLLLEFGDELDAALEVDNNVQSRFAAQGLAGAVEPRALVRHSELPLRDAARGNHTYGRLVAACRVRDEGWARPRRVAYAIAAPLGAPLARGTRLVRSLRGRRPLWLAAATGLPGAALIWLSSGLGLSVGFLFGPGDAERRLADWEVQASRSTNRGEI